MGTLVSDDLDPFFQVGEFAYQAVLDGVSVPVIFDNGYRQALEGIATLEPSVILPTTLAAGATQSSTLVLEGTTYRVRSNQQDGNGVSKLTLERQ